MSVTHSSVPIITNQLTHLDSSSSVVPENKTHVFNLSLKTWFDTTNVPTLFETLFKLCYM